MGNLKLDFMYKCIWDPRLENEILRLTQTQNEIEFGLTKYLIFWYVTVK